MTLLELAQQTGLNPKWAAGTGGGVYHSPCPACGGTDRFYIQPYKQMSKCLGAFRCRQCGVSGDSIQFARQFLNLSFVDAAKEVNAIISEQPFLAHLRKQSYQPVLQGPSSLWITRANEFVNEAHNNLLGKSEVLQWLSSRGLPVEAIQRYKIGWSNKNHFFKRSEWGLPEQISQEGKPRSLWIPRGIVIPTSQADGKVLRLKVRRADYQQDDTLQKYIAISGSMNGMSIVGDLKNKIMVVVESELDAYAIDHALQGSVITVGVGSNIKNPDNITDRLTKNAERLLICHDNDEAGKKMLIKWQKLYSNATAYPTPFGKDIGEAIEKGLSLREWILKSVSCS